jgi:hypothetical protein
VHKFIHPNGSVLFVQQPKEAKDVAAFLAKEPRPMLAEPPTVSRGVMRLALGWHLCYWPSSSPPPFFW